MDLVFLPLIAVVVVALVWMWWTARGDRDPVSSVDSFNRALTAMRPGAEAPQDEDDSAASEADAAGEPGPAPSRSGPRSD